MQTNISGVVEGAVQEYKRRKMQKNKNTTYVQEN